MTSSGEASECRVCGAALRPGARFCAACGAPREADEARPPESPAATSAPVHSGPPAKPAAARSSPPPVGGVPRAAIDPRHGVLAAASALVVALVVAVLLSGGDAAPPASSGDVAGQPAVEGDGTSSQHVDQAPPESEPLQVIAGDGYSLSVPDGPDWRVGEAHEGNRGLQIHTLVYGPDGIVIRIVHTPRHEAKPDPDKVYDGGGTVETAAERSEMVTLEDFPTPECEDRLCDDFVLNDPAFGGLAILANGSGDEPAARAARAIAESLVTG